jgi:hypothetical protein
VAQLILLVAVVLGLTLTWRLVQNVPLGRLHRRANRLGDSLPDRLRDGLLCLLVLHGRFPRRGSHLRSHLSADDLFVGLYYPYRRAS